MCNDEDEVNNAPPRKLDYNELKKVNDDDLRNYYLYNKQDMNRIHSTFMTDETLIKKLAECYCQSKKKTSDESKRDKLQPIVTLILEKTEYKLLEEELDIAYRENNTTLVSILKDRYREPSRFSDRVQHWTIDDFIDFLRHFLEEDLISDLVGSHSS